MRRFVLPATIHAPNYAGRTPTVTNLPQCFVLVSTGTLVLHMQHIHLRHFLRLLCIAQIVGQYL